MKVREKKGKYIPLKVEKREKKKKDSFQNDGYILRWGEGGGS